MSAMSAMKDFKGKGAIVTGAASGIGLGIARTLARAGANVVLADIEVDALERARAEVAALGVNATALRLDVSDRSAMAKAALDAEAALGKVHLVFNNAGVELSGRALAQIEDSEWDWIIGVNVHGVINGIRHFVPLIQKHGEPGHVVNTASVAGFWVNPNFRLGPYSMTKYAVVALTEALAQDLEGGPIGVSMFCPAAVNTRIFTSSRNRPTRFGGPYQPGVTESLRNALAKGLSPDEAGERVLRGIRDNDLYIFSHAAPRTWFEARFKRILDSFARATH